MPKLLFLWIVSLALLGQGGCDGASRSQQYRENPASGASFGVRERRSLLALFQALDSFPLSVSTKVGEWEGPESAKFHWKGRPLPKKYWVLLDSLIPLEENYSGETVYATSRFRVNRQTQALLLRVPGQYWSSQMYLLLLDTASFRPTGAYRLAESWADAGDSFYLETVISAPAANQYRLESHQGECHPVDENYKTFRCTDTLTVGLLQDTTIKIISRKRVLGDKQ
jgi:hypothetical protein